MSANPARLRRSRLSIDVEPELRRKIKVVAAQKDLTVREYLEAILRRAVEAEEQATTEGDELACLVWDQCAYYLAIGCVNICRIFDPEMIVLGGGMARAGEDLMRPVMKHFAELDWSLTARLTEIRLAELGNDAGVIGAAGVAWATIAKDAT